MLKPIADKPLCDVTLRDLAEGETELSSRIIAILAKIRAIYIALPPGISSHLMRKTFIRNGTIKYLPQNELPINFDLLNTELILKRPSSVFESLSNKVFCEVYGLELIESPADEPKPGSDNVCVKEFTSREDLDKYVSETGGGTLVFFLGCHPGCACCPEKIHIRGPYATKEEAERREKFFLSPETIPAASSSAFPQGRYRVFSTVAVNANDGTVILMGKKIPSLEFIKVLHDGSIMVDRRAEVFPE